MKSTVYLETTIPSFYYETRTGAEFVAMRDWTRQWWDNGKDGYRCFVSIAVLDELENGNHPKKKEKIALLSGIDYLEINDEIEEIVEVYIARWRDRMKDNATVREIRETRKRISARFEHDPKRLVEYYKQKQKEKLKSDFKNENAEDER